MTYGQDAWTPEEQSHNQPPSYPPPYDAPRDAPYGRAPEQDPRAYGQPPRPPQQQPRSHEAPYGRAPEPGQRPYQQDPRRVQPPYARPDGYDPRTDPRSRQAGPDMGADAGMGAQPMGPGRAGHRRADPAGETSAFGPGQVNQDLDLDQVDPAGRTRRRSAQSATGRRNPRRRKVIKYTALSMAGVLIAAVGVGFYLVNHLLGNVQTVSLDNLQNRPAAAKPNSSGQVPLNILVLGSQTRDGQNLATHVGNSTKAGTDLSDTAFLVHISADRKWTEVVSIPRDLFVAIPSCQDRLNPSSTHSAQSAGQFYDAMGEGGPACAVATVEQMTNIRVDHFVELTFNAFIQLTDAVGGVQVCVPPPGINDPNYSGLVIPAGLHTVQGNEALAFVRDRHGLVSGMDTQRIRMQQMFMTSLFDKMTASGTIEDPVTLYKIANAVTSNITVDTSLDNVSTMISIAQAVGTINKKYMQYITAPYVLDRPGEFSYDRAGMHSSPGPGFTALWNYLRSDTPLPGSPAAAKFGASTSSSAGAVPSTTAGASQTASLNGLQVKVYNGTGISGEAAHAAANLKAMGVTTTIGYSGYAGYQTTTILYPSGRQSQADALAGQIAGSVAKQSSNVSGLVLVIGANAPSAIVAAPSGSGTGTGGGGGGTAASPGAPSPTITVQTRNGDENLCSNLPGVVGYGGSPRG